MTQVSIIHVKEHVPELGLELDSKLGDGGVVVVMTYVAIGAMLQVLCVSHYSR